MPERGTSQPIERTDMEYPSERVIEAVAAYSNTKPLELPPLYNTIDPDALNSLFQSKWTTGRIEFLYYDHKVTITNGGEIDLTAVND